tara:strand:- start:308 stop:541 length:234 start_codon:yes stop_codon:yes gene_type:complete
MKKGLISKILGIIAWGLIIFSVIGLILKSLGIINSPPLTEILLGAMLIELIRIEKTFKEFSIKQSILWSDLQRRKDI